MAGRAANIRGAGATTTANANLCALFDDLVDIDAYYTYKGSLTTPDCYESVTWIVFKDPITAKPVQVIEAQVQCHAFNIASFNVLSVAISSSRTSAKCSITTENSWWTTSGVSSPSTGGCLGAPSSRTKRVCVYCCNLLHAKKLVFVFSSILYFEFEIYSLAGFCVLLLYRYKPYILMLGYST